MKLPMVCTAAAASLLALNPITGHAQRPGGSDDGIRPARQGTDDDSLRTVRGAGRIRFDRNAAVSGELDGVSVTVTPRADLESLSAEALAKGAVLAEFDVRGSGAARDSARTWKATLPDGRLTFVVRRQGEAWVGAFVLDGKSVVARVTGDLHAKSLPKGQSVHLTLTPAGGKGGPSLIAKRKTVVRTCFKFLGINVFCIERTTTVGGNREEDEEW